MIAYDPSRDALLRPEIRQTIFYKTDHSPLELAVEAARLAYYRFEESQAEVDRLNAALACVGFGQAVPFHSDSLTGTEAFGALHQSGATALLAFRGTQPDKLADLGTDANAVPVGWAPLGAGKVHAGFLRAYMAVHPAIERWLKGPAAGRSELIVTGHSLGGALACLCAGVMRPTQLVTLGGPRTGDDDFVRSLDTVPWTRLVDCCDMVTRVPPEVLGYRHPDFRTYIAADGSTHQSPSDAFIAADRDAGRLDYLEKHAWRVGTVAVRDFADHAPINYARGVFAGT